jgi:hypothetical protein
LRKPGFRGKNLRQLGRKPMKSIARAKLVELGLMILRNIPPAIDSQSGGKRLCASGPKDHILPDANGFTTGAKNAPANTEAV